MWGQSPTWVSWFRKLALDRSTFALTIHSILLSCDEFLDDPSSYSTVLLCLCWCMYVCLYVEEELGFGGIDGGGSRNHRRPLLTNAGRCLCKIRLFCLFVFVVYCMKIIVFFTLANWEWVIKTRTLFWLLNQPRRHNTCFCRCLSDNMLVGCRTHWIQEWG